MTDTDGIHALLKAVKTELRVRHRLFIYLFITTLFGITLIGLLVRPSYTATIVLQQEVINQDKADNTFYQQVQALLKSDALQQKLTADPGARVLIENIDERKLRLSYQHQNKRAALTTLDDIATYIRGSATIHNLPKVYVDIERELYLQQSKIKDNKMQRDRLNAERNAMDLDNIAATKEGINAQIQIISESIRQTENKIITILDKIASKQQDLSQLSALQGQIDKEKASIKKQRLDLLGLEDKLLAEYEKEIQFSAAMSKLENLHYEFQGLQRNHERMLQEKMHLVQLFDIDPQSTLTTITITEASHIASGPSVNKQPIFVSAVFAAVFLPVIVALMIITFGSGLRFPTQLNSLSAVSFSPATLPHMHSQLGQRIVKKEVFYLLIAIVIYGIVVAGNPIISETFF